MNSNSTFKMKEEIVQFSFIPIFLDFHNFDWTKVLFPVLSYNFTHTLWHPPPLPLFLFLSLSLSLSLTHPNNGIDIGQFAFVHQEHWRKQNFKPPCHQILNSAIVDAGFFNFCPTTDSFMFWLSYTHGLWFNEYRT